MYHIGFFLQKYGSLDNYANFSLESKHRLIKKRKENTPFNLNRNIVTKDLLVKEIHSWENDIP